MRRCQWPGADMWKCGSEKVGQRWRTHTDGDDQRTRAPEISEARGAAAESLKLQIGLFSLSSVLCEGVCTVKFVCCWCDAVCCKK